MPMSFRRYVALHVLVLATVNSTINAGYTWWLWRSPDRLQLTGSDGIAFDLAGTPIWIAVLTTLLGTAAVQRKLWEGRFREPGFAIPRIFGLLPANIAVRALVTGLLASIALALPLWAALQRFPVEALPLEHAVMMKVALTALFTTCIVPLVVLAATADMRVPRDRNLPTPGTAGSCRLG